MFAEKKRFFICEKSFKTFKQLHQMQFQEEAVQFWRVIDVVKKGNLRRSTKNMVKEIDISNKSLKEDYETWFENKAIQDSTTTVVLKCFQVKSTCQREDKVRGDSACQRQSRRVGQEVFHGGGCTQLSERQGARYFTRKLSRRSHKAF